MYGDILTEALERLPMSVPHRSSRPLLLVSFLKKGYAPDREKLQRIIDEGPHKDSKEYYNFTTFNHHRLWLKAISEHKFVLVPFGNGLDTHRMYEVLIMGGIPVTRRSSISSCYDDSDNVFGNSSRGSIPIVILESWEDLSKSRLDAEWERIVQTPIENWDWSRLLAYQWNERIKASATVSHN